MISDHHFLSISTESREGGAGDTGNRGGRRRGKGDEMQATGGVSGELEARGATTRGCEGKMGIFLGGRMLLLALISTVYLQKWYQNQNLEV